MNLFDVENKVVVITGGSGLIGKQIVNAFINLESKVVNIDIQEYINNCDYYNTDITIESNVKNVIDKIVRKHNKIDVWINCFYPKNPIWNQTANKLSSEFFEASVMAHLNGVFLCTKLVGNMMKKMKTKGVIINFSSIYGSVIPNLDMYKGTGKVIPISYGIAKSSIINMTKHFAVLYGKYGIRVNSISPTAVFNNQHNKISTYYNKSTPLKRMLSAEEIPGTVVFLSSEASSYITGQNIIIDGGYTLI